MNSAADPLALIRNTPQAMRRASVMLGERADACDDPLVAAELQRLAGRCARRACELQPPNVRTASVFDQMLRRRRR
jgi:hypothetical protein